MKLRLYLWSDLVLLVHIQRHVRAMLDPPISLIFTNTKTTHFLLIKKKKKHSLFNTATLSTPKCCSWHVEGRVFIDEAPQPLSSEHLNVLIKVLCWRISPQAVFCVHLHFEDVKLRCVVHFALHLLPS